jgi:hypothetical protein
MHVIIRGNKSRKFGVILNLAPFAGKKIVSTLDFSSLSFVPRIILLSASFVLTSFLIFILFIFPSSFVGSLASTTEPHNGYHAPKVQIEGSRNSDSMLPLHNSHIIFSTRHTLTTTLICNRVFC